MKNGKTSLRIEKFCHGSASFLLRVDIKKPKNFCCCNFKYRQTHTKAQASALSLSSKSSRIDEALLATFLASCEGRDEVFKSRVCLKVEKWNSVFMGILAKMLKKQVCVSHFFRYIN